MSRILSRHNDESKQRSRFAKRCSLSCGTSFSAVILQAAQPARASNLLHSRCTARLCHSFKFEKKNKTGRRNFPSAGGSCSTHPLLRTVLIVRYAAGFFAAAGLLRAGAFFGAGWSGIGLILFSSTTGSVPW